MTVLPPHLCAKTWLGQLFSSTEARWGGLVKRKVRDVERLVGRARFLEETRRRDLQVIENGHHFVILCNSQPLRRLL